jgi:hypothetical protein
MLTVPIRNSALALAVTLLAASAVPAAERYDPRLRFRTIRTAHFDVHAHQGEEALARRLAVIVERVRLQFEPVFGVARGRVQVILVDQTDVSNGWATPLPYNTIEITAVPPASETLIGNTTDWLELVFTHEYTHILHLGRSRGLMEGLRHVFGRVPVVFPNVFLPVWQVEGIATFEESRMTGEGRIPAGDFRAIVDIAAAQHRFEPIDRAGGGLDDWPGGLAAYAYGAYFHQYLADRYGPERLSRLADATAGRVPFFGSGAFGKVFGRSSRALWRDFQESRERAPLPHSDTDTRATRLTHHGFVVSASAAAADGVLYYRLADASGFPTLMRRTPDGDVRRIAWRVQGNRTSVRGDWIVFDQLERTRSVNVYSDLYAVRTSGGPVIRLTRNARAADPDLSPDRRRIVCTIQATGRRALALFDSSGMLTSAANAVAVRTRLRSPQALVDDPESDYTGPRWSPDGHAIVAERRRQDGYDLVVIDPNTRTVRTLVHRTDARLVTPSWTPDGTTILFSADLDGEPFNVFAVDLATGDVRRVTDTVGGAQFPELSPSGALTYVGYTAAGYDLFSVQTDHASWTAVVPAGAQANPVRHTMATDNPPPSTAYRPQRTLAPTFWTPIIESDAGETVIGAGTLMFDALGRHTYAVDAGWSGARRRPDWRAAYAYDRWRPTLFASYSDDTDPIRGGEVRSRELFAGALLPFRHIRWTETLLAGIDTQTDTLSCTSACRVRDAHRELRSVRAGWLHDSRRLFGYSIGTEEGFAVETAAESSRTSFGSDVDAGASIIDARAFRRVFGAHTVLAGRAAAALAWGEVAARRVFSAAGSGPKYPVFDFGRDSVGLLRGFAPEDVIGTRTAVVNLELRAPLRRIERGAGSWPFFIRSVHTAAFVDVGNAWDTRFRTTDLRTSTGAELSVDLVVLHYFPLTLVSGGAWTRDPVAARDRVAFFGRIGHAF